VAAERRVVVTGMSMVTTLGPDLESSWEGLKQGRSGIGEVRHFDTSPLPVHFAGCIGEDFDPRGYLSKRDRRTLSLFLQYGLVAGLQAAEDAGLEINDDNAGRIGVIAGAGIGGLYEIEHNAQRYLDRGMRAFSPYYIPSTIINMVAGELSIRLGARGPNFSLVSACATGSHNIGCAQRLIRCGDSDAILAGGCEMATTPTGIGGFAAARALSRRNDDPQAASRPWDAERDGFVIGDGAGMLMLEEYEHARRRGARIYAELVGFGASADAYHITAPEESGQGMQTCMRLALEDAAIAPEAIGYINAHATSTPLGDVIESKAVEAVFGEHGRRLALSSTKSMLGHMLGAAGSVEAIIAMLALRDGVLPPTINLRQPDPQCMLDYVPGEAREAQVSAVMSNSFGFGGTNSCLVFNAPP